MAACRVEDLQQSITQSAERVVLVNAAVCSPHSVPSPTLVPYSPVTSSAINAVVVYLSANRQCQ